MDDEAKSKLAPVWPRYPVSADATSLVGGRYESFPPDSKRCALTTRPSSPAGAPCRRPVRRRSCIDLRRHVDQQPLEDFDIRRPLRNRPETARVERPLHTVIGMKYPDPFQIDSPSWRLPARCLVDASEHVNFAGRQHFPGISRIRCGIDANDALTDTECRCGRCRSLALRSGSAYCESPPRWPVLLGALAGFLGGMPASVSSEMENHRNDYSCF